MIETLVQRHHPRVMDIIAETDRLILVKMTPRDTALLYQLTGNPQVMRFFPNVLNYPDTRRMITKIVSHYSKNGYCYWKLLHKNKSDFLGIAGLLDQEIDGNAETEISYRIKPEYWNLGYATEAAKACKQYGQNVLKKRRLISLIHPENIASKRVAQKLGAKKANTTTFLGLAHEIYVYNL